MKLLKSKRVVLENETRPAALLIENETIKDILPYDVTHGLSSDVEVHDYDGYALMPGVVDTHVHINQPGRTEWEGFSTATAAAARGGITTLVDMPLNCQPVTTTASALQIKINDCKDLLHVDCGFYGGIVPENQNDIEALIDAGVLGFKSFLIHSGIDEFKHVNETHIRRVIPLLKKANVPYLMHAELEDEVTGLQKADPRLYSTYLASRPRRWENKAIEMMTRLSGETKAHLHVVHLSSGDTLEILHETKKNSIPISVETCHHYLTYCAEEIPDGHTEYKCAPPIRERENREKLWKALSDGTIDFAVSDHSPCTPDLKQMQSGDFMKAWGGIAGLQFSLSVFYTGAISRGLSLNDISRLMSAHPARFAGLEKKGALQKGNHADIIVFDTDSEFTVMSENIAHKHEVSPYVGMKLKGIVKETWLRGKRIFDKNVTFSPGGRTILRGQA